METLIREGEPPNALGAGRLALCGRCQGGDGTEGPSVDRQSTLLGAQARWNRRRGAAQRGVEAQPLVRSER